MRIATRRDAGLDLAQIDAAHRDRAVGRVGEAGEQLRERRLAAAGLTHDRDVLARGDRDVDVSEHRGAVAVAEGHVVHGDVERAVGRQPHAVVGLLDLDRQIEHREDLAPAGDRGLGLGVDLGQVLEHAQEHVAEEQERHRRAEP